MYVDFLNTSNYSDWTILDQLAVAGMIVGNDSLATVLTLLKYKTHMKKCIETLAAKFPTSPRTYVLMGMHLEAQEKLSDAAEYYEYVLTNDPTNIVYPLSLTSDRSLFGNVELPFFDRSNDQQKPSTNSLYSLIPSPTTLKLGRNSQIYIYHRNCYRKLPSALKS